MPSDLEGRALGDGTFLSPIDRWTLLVAIKPSCDGCRDFVHSSLEELSDVDVVIVSGAEALDGEWSGAIQNVAVAPDLLAALDLRWPPTYILIDPDRASIVAEGVVFTALQVAEEIARFVG